MGLASITNNILTDTGITPSGVISGTLGTGQVAYGSAANTIAGSNNLFWDNTNGRLGIGTNVPARQFVIYDGASGVPHLQWANASTGVTNADGFQIRLLSTNQVHFTNFENSAMYFGNQGITGQMTLYPSGNLAIGTSASDGGQRLQVYGDTLLRGSGNDSTTTALTVQKSDFANILRVRNDGATLYGESGAYIATIAVSTGSINSAGAGLRFEQNDGSSIGRSFVFTGASIISTTNTRHNIQVQQTFAPTSGTAIFNNLTLEQTINQTGGANGITRGLYVNPTLTAAADWRSIEWNNNSGWGLYGAGTANSYFGGSVGIGSTNLAGYTMRLQKSLTGAASAFGIYQAGEIQSDVTSSGVGFRNDLTIANATFTVTNYFHFQAAQGTIGASATLTNQFGFRVNNSLIGATNNYGFFGDIASGTGRWNLYMAGTANNFMNGALAIGFTSAINAANFGINKTMTGGTTWINIVSQSQINSDVTSVAYSFRSRLSTQAASFTLGTLTHYSASNGGLGAGSAITTQYGFVAEADLTQATNNYGFFGNIASGTGRWNLYMAGTAANYLNGSLLIGSATDDGINKLQVTGSILATTNSTISGLSVGKGAGNVATNTAVGVSALNANTTGFQNTAVGASALLTNSTGTQNTAVGNDALRLNTVGIFNSAFGHRASRANTTGNTNSAFGVDALRLNSVGSNNAAFGGQALDNNTAGDNTAIGTGALLDNTTGVGNTALGYRAGFAGSLLSNLTGSNNIFIGADSIGESTSASNRTFIGNTSTTSTWLGGNLLLGSRTDDGVNRLQVSGAFKTTGVNTLSDLQGTGSRMVVADANGVLSTQTIPGGSITGTGVSGQVTFWTGASSQAGSPTFTFGPSTRLFLNNTVIAATNVARGFHITSQLSAFANNDDLVGIDLSPAYTTSGLPTGVHAIGIRTATSFTPTQTDIRYTAFLIQPFINQGGTSTGITRGVHVNPTLTSAADWRSVEWSNNSGYGLLGVGSAQNLLNGKLTVSPTVLAANFTNANTISVLASQVLNIPAGTRGADGNVYSAATGANYFRFNGTTTLFGDALWSGSTNIANIQFDTTGTVTMANSATTGYRPLSVMQLQMQASGANSGTVDKGATLFIQGVYPASLTGTVTFTDYAAIRINDLKEWGGTAVVLTNRWGIYQSGADDKNYFAASVGVGVDTPVASAKLQVDSTTQGFLPPRMTNVQMNAIATPAAGLIVYNTTDNKHYGYNGTTWNAFY